MIDIYSSPNFETEFEPEVIERGKKVKLVIADVDGVLTDGSIYKAKDPATLGDIEFKQFSIVDGAGTVTDGVTSISGRDRHRWPCTIIRPVELCSSCVIIPMRLKK